MSANKLTCFLVGLRLRASPPGFAFFGLRLLRASPSGIAPSSFAFGRARRHDSTQNPWAMRVVVRACPTKHPRHTTVVFTTKRRRAVFCSRASCCLLHLLRSTSPTHTRQVADCFFLNNFFLNAFPTQRIRKFASHARCEPTASSSWPWWFDAAISRYKEKTCPFVRFFTFTCSQNVKMAPFSLISNVCGHV